MSDLDLRHRLKVLWATMLAAFGQETNKGRELALRAIIRAVEDLAPADAATVLSNALALVCAAVGVSRKQFREQTARVYDQQVRNLRELAEQEGGSP